MRIPLIFLCSTLFFAPLSYADNSLPPLPPLPPLPDSGGPGDFPPFPNDGSPDDDPNGLLTFTRISIDACGPAPKLSTLNDMISCLEGKPDPAHPETQIIKNCKPSGSPFNGSIRCDKVRIDNGKVVFNSSFAHYGTPKKCEQFQGQLTPRKYWPEIQFGSGREICSSGCELKISGLSPCTTGSCQGQFMYTGDSCSYSGFRTLQIVPPFCKWNSSRVSYDCPEDADNNGLVDDPRAPIDNAAICGFDALDSFGCTGGTFGDGSTDPDTGGGGDLDEPDPTDPDGGDTVNPDEPPEQPDVDDTNTGDLTGVINSILSQNKDINTGFNNLIVANNKGFAEINTRLNSIDSNTYAINDNLSKQLLQDYKLYKAEKEQREKALQEAKKTNAEFLKNDTEIKSMLAAINQSVVNVQRASGDVVMATNDSKRILDNINRTTQQTSDNEVRALESVERAVESNQRAVESLERTVGTDLTNAIDTASRNQIGAINDVGSKIDAQTSALTSSLEGQTETLKGAIEGIDIDVDTGDLGGAVGSLKGSIDGQTDALVAASGELKGAIDGQGESLDGISDQLDDLLEKLEPCEPTKENNYCENPHGLGSDYVGTALGQADSVFSDNLDTYEKTITDAVQSMADKSLTTESESHIEKLSTELVSVLPKPSGCVDLSFPTFGGGSASIDCKFSQQLKMIFSLLIYIYTLKALAEILLTEVTPVPGNKPSSRGYY